MTPSRLLGPIAAALACACAAWPVEAAAAASGLCADTARHASGDPRIRSAVDEAHRQHQWFGGQFIDRNGGMFRLGYHEAEWDRPPGQSTPTWERIATYWQALSASDPPRVMTSSGWVARSEALRQAATQDSEGGPAALAVREALLRTAIVDTPWSAAFISYVMKSAGFSRDEFAFSDTHADYVQAALDASSAEAEGREVPYAFRACDVATTPPRAGDLLCATRASRAGIDSFGMLAAALATRPPGQPFPMHCELVVRSDEGGDAKIDTIGGNVVQSVTLSRMTLNANKLLSAQYIGAAERPDCVPGGPPCRAHLSRRHWVVLLQSRK